MTIVDIRPAWERDRDGAVPEAVIAEYDGSVEGRGRFVGFIRLAQGQTAGRPVALLCRQGIRAIEAERVLRAAGLTNVHVIAGGTLGNAADPGWILWGLPLRHGR